jgi:DNA repair protein SbcC/Rad50
MLTRIEIADYQSIRRAKIPVGMLTVITGPTGSGKSALIRALLMLCRNARGNGYVRRGAAFCAVAAVETGGQASRAVLLRRGARTTTGDFYRVQARGAEPQEFTKLGGKVPDQVADVLRLEPVNFAGQFDAPFLLAEQGTEVARVLGTLTNVTMVLLAAAEAGRRRKGFDRDAKGAEGRLSQLQGQLASFGGLEAQRAAIAEAEQRAAGLQAQAAALLRLELLITRLEDGEAEVAAARAGVTRSTPPDLSKLEAGLARWLRLGELIEAHGSATAGIARHSAEAALGAERERAAHEAVHAALAEAGQCPMCGSKIAA